MSAKRLLSWLTATALVIGLLVAPGSAAAADKGDLARGKPVTTSSNAAGAAMITDGNRDTYWESSAKSGDQWARVDLGTVARLDRAVLTLPDASGQQVSVQTSSDGTTFTNAGVTQASGTVRLGEVEARFVRVGFAGRAKLSAIEVYAAALSTTNLVAAVQSVSASSNNAPYNAQNAADGNQATYWESTNNVFPQWIQADLGASLATNRLVLKLPTGWEARTQTLTVQQSANGSTFTDLVASAGYRFDPASGNTVTITFGSVTTRYVRLNITANTGWPAGQLSELEVYGPSTGDTEAPTAPTNVAYTQLASGQIRLTWTGSTDNVGVTGYDVYANGSLASSVGADVRTFTDTQPASATVTYFVRARDAAGNQSANSNTVTRTGTSAGVNLAVGKPITESGHVHTFVATNANDDDVTTYWEGNGNAYPNTLTVSLGANAAITSIVLKLNPDTAWGPRTQTFEVLGRDQAATGFTSIVGSQQYSFSPSSGNLVTIPVSATAADVRLQFTANTGAPAGQVAEVQVIGQPAPNPDLQITGLTWTPASPSESDAVTLSATVRNAGDRPAAATATRFYFGDTSVGTASVGTLAAGATATVSANIGARDAGSYTPRAVVDEDNAVIEKVETNNAFTSPTALVIAAVPTSDLVGSVSWTPSTPQNGAAVNFSVAIRNQGTVASAGGAHGITLTVTNATTGAVVSTLTGSANGAIAPGVTTSPVALGTWTAANGRYTVKVVIAVDGNELAAKQANNTSTQSLFVGRGANMPYDTYEAEDGVTGGGASVIGPNRTVGDLAGEASGRRAVTLNSTGAYVEWTTKASTNTLVTRFSIPDSAGGGGRGSTLNVYVDGVFQKTINLTSKYAWLYGAEAGPGDSPGAGTPRHIYDEANIMLNSSVPQGHKIRLQKDAANDTNYAIDFVSLEQVAPIANPDPAHYAVPAGFTQQDVQNALDRARQEANLVGVYLPPGDYQTSSKFQVYLKSVRVIGAGPWYTRFYAPSTQDNTDVGFRADSGANGSVFSGFAYFGNYIARIDGPGKVFDFSGVANMTIENIWVEHMVCLYWGANTDNMTLRNNRIRDTFADGINMTNGSSGNLVANNESRATGDDSFALFNAQDGGGGEVTGNTFENLTSLLTWRAAGIAVYGGYDNVFRNLYVADTLVYSGITISSLDFGIPMNGFGASPPTRFENASIVRSGGHFWGAQTFPGIWVYSATKIFQGIRVSDVDIVDPTYHGIMFQTDYVGGQPLYPVADTVFTNVSISGARKSGDAYNDKSGFGIWANELPEDGEGPARGSVTFTNLTLSNNAQDIRNTTTTFTIIRN
jgi:hypothetical protein